VRDRDLQVADTDLRIRVSRDAVDGEIADTEADPEVAMPRHINGDLEAVATALGRLQLDLGLRSVDGELANPVRRGVGIVLPVRCDDQAELAVGVCRLDAQIADVGIDDHQAAGGEGRLAYYRREA